MTKIRKLTLLFLLCITLMMMTACGKDEDGQEHKQAAIDALKNSESYESYTYSGKADLNMTFAANPDEPLTSMILKLFEKSNLEWTGATTTSPVQAEAIFRLTPKGTDQTMEIPSLVKDNKLYLHIPLISGEDEYFVSELGQAEQLSGAQAILNSFIAGISESPEANHFTASDEDAKDQYIRMEINEDNIKDVAAAFFEQIANLSAELSESGITPVSNESKNNTISKEEIEDKASKVSINKPGHITVYLNPEQQYTGLEVSLHMSYSSGNADTTVMDMTLENHISDIGKAPVWTIEAPTDAKPLEDVIRFFR